MSSSDLRPRGLLGVTYRWTRRADRVLHRLIDGLRHRIVQREYKDFDTERWLAEERARPQDRLTAEDLDKMIRLNREGLGR